MAMDNLTFYRWFSHIFPLKPQFAVDFPACHVGWHRRVAFFSEEQGPERASVLLFSRPGHGAAHTGAGRSASWLSIPWNWDRDRGWLWNPAPPRGWLKHVETLWDKPPPKGWLNHGEALQKNGIGFNGMFTIYQLVQDFAAASTVWGQFQIRWP